VHRQRERGQAVAEFAILLPVLALIVLGCLDLGRVFSVWLALSNGTREGADYVAANPTARWEDVEAHALADLGDLERLERQGVLLGPIDFDIDPDTADERIGGQPVTVTAQCSVTLVTTYLFKGQPVAIKASTQMAVLPGKK